MHLLVACARHIARPSRLVNLVRCLGDLPPAPLGCRELLLKLKSLLLLELLVLLLLGADNLEGVLDVTRAAQPQPLDHLVPCLDRQLGTLRLRNALAQAVEIALATRLLDGVRELGAARRLSETLLL